MIDTYICASDEEVLGAFCADFKNVIGPVRGRGEKKAFKAFDGLDVPAQEAVGDPAKFYACVRSEEALKLPKGIEACDDKTGSALCGVWA